MFFVLLTFLVVPHSDLSLQPHDEFWQPGVFEQRFVYLSRDPRSPLSTTTMTDPAFKHKRVFASVRGGCVTIVNPLLHKLINAV